MKKLLFLLLLLSINLLAFSQLDTVFVGTTPNDHTGDPLRTAFIKTMDNFYYHEGRLDDTINFDNVMVAWLGFYNVKDYGAVGDSITDDTDAIQTAVDAVPEEGGTVYFPQGIYRIEGTIHITTPVHLLGVPVMSMIFSQPPSADYWYNAGSVLMSKGSAKAMIDINTGRGAGSVEHRGSVIEYLHFYDEKDYNDTLVVIRMTNYAKVNNCIFTEGAVGLKVDALVEDASWIDVTGNHFRNNNVSIWSTANASAADVPITHIYGGSFHVKDNQTGIRTEKSGFTTITNLKMDVRGTHCIGIDWGAIQKGGIGGSITDVKFETEGDDSTCIAIRTRTGMLSITGVGIMGTTYGTGIWVKAGVSPVDPVEAVSMTTCTFSGLDYGLIVEDSTAGIQMVNGNFRSNISKFAIKLRPNSGSNQFHNIIIGDPFYTAISDSSTNTTWTNINYINGGTRRYYHIYPQETGALTDGAPTDAQLDTEFGFTAAQAGRGFRRTIRDTNGTGLLYIVESDGTNWFYITTVKAL
jgi:hypothetical protein